MSEITPLPPAPPGRYRHYKGGEYELVAVARHSETHEPLVVYRPLYNDTGWWVRPHAMFFGSVEIDGAARPRFERIEPATAAHAALDATAAALAARWQDAWNRHDMSALDEIATEDADWVTVGGTRLVGRAQVRAVHEQLHAGALAATAWTNDAYSVAAVGPGTALLHLNWTVRGERQPDGTPRPPRRGVFSWLLVADAAGLWRIRAAHGTNVPA